MFFVLALAAAGVSESSSLLPDAAKAKSAAASVFEILDRKSKIHSGDKSGITLQQVKGNIEFQHVCFKYPTRPDVQILKGLCLTVQSGKVTQLYKHIKYLPFTFRILAMLTYASISRK